MVYSDIRTKRMKRVNNGKGIFHKQETPKVVNVDLL